MSWELDLWGRLRRGIESNNATLDASVESYDDALVTLLADVATNYVQYRVAQQRIKIARDNVRIQEGILNLALDKFRVGTASRLDSEQARTVLGTNAFDDSRTRDYARRANDTLCTLLGMPPRDLEGELGSGPGSRAKSDVEYAGVGRHGHSGRSLRQRPDVRRAERQVAAQSAQIGVAEAALYPTLAVNGLIGWDAANFNQLFETKSFIGAVFPSFNWNILNYGRIKNNVRQQIAKTEELIATYQTQVLTAAREVQVPLRGFLKAREQADDLARAVAAAKAATELGVQQYRTGVIDFNRVFNLETAQVQQQDNLAVAEGDIALNLINVYRGLGGGWELRLEREAHGVGPAAPNGAPDIPPAPPAPPVPMASPPSLPALQPTP